MSWANSMSCFNDIDFAPNEPPGFQPKLLRSGFVRFGSLGLMVAAAKLGELEGMDCAAQNCASEITSEKTAQVNRDGRDILN